MPADPSSTSSRSSARRPADPSPSSGAGGADDSRRSIREERAGLLWMLLSPETRRRAASELSLAEIEKLNEGYKRYRKRKARERGRREREVAVRISSRMSPWPLLLSVAGAALFGILFVLHMAFVDKPMEVRLQYFQYLFLAVLAPGSLYLIKPYRLRALFWRTLQPEQLAGAFFAYLALVWLLAFIGFEQRSAVPIDRPDPLSLAILCLAAVAAPLLEENLFRELMPSLFGASPHYIGHLISALLFGFAHLPSSYAMYAGFVAAALLLSGLRLHSEGLLLPFLAHAGANLTVVLVDL